MRMKAIAIVIVIILVAVTVTGSVFLNTHSGKHVTPPPDISFKHDITAPPASGWISSPNATDVGNTTAKVSIDVNGTYVDSVIIDITINDDDGNHSESDKGSDPDTVLVTIGEENITGETDKASGEYRVHKEYRKGSELDMFNETITVTIAGQDFGGGNHPYGPLGHFQNPLLVYIDQGCEYKVEIKFTYWSHFP
jgi:hypothetical protein